jgi:hypothetical protein
MSRPARFDDCPVGYGMPMVKRVTKPGGDADAGGITMHCRVDIFAPGYLDELRRALASGGDDAPGDPSTESEEDRALS